ncbi:protein kinase [Halomicronema sp. CCY15110]|uniref:protein kinase domain-containing protein n=1 Tax=Halomicronema sp. CCY15110 TaxID=2767773 RepID=UPI00194DF668|nr:protein kinase [Halomicronema sp. CCY15110]
MNYPIPDNSQGQRTLAAIVLTDAVGFSARMSIDEENTLSLIHRDLGLMESLCQQFEGRMIKSTGDGLLMCFSSAVQAVHCSLEMQHQLADAYQAIPPEQRLEHRIGVHLGDVFFKDGDVMGNGVNIAARLQTEAHPGGICISQIAYDVVKSRVELNATYAGPLQLKNIQEPQPAYHIDPHGKAATDDATATYQESVISSEATRREPDHAGSSRAKLGPGSKVGGRYVIQRVLGQGGFGRSYLVEDSQRFGEACVLKEFFPRNASKRSLQKALDLFKREAKTLYQINHPQVPKFLAGFTQEQRLFIVQEYIDGVTYSHLLKERKRNGQTFTEPEIKRWLIHMLQVLEYLHGLNIVHRDISPDNVMYCRERDLPILIDFGLVNDAMNEILSGEDEQDEDAPRTATVVGKFGYSPPEQIQLGQCFPCSDLYALGVTAIVMLTGRYPRELMNRHTLDWQWEQQVAISSSFAMLLRQLIHRQPQERFQSALAVLEALTPLLGVEEVSSPLPQSMLTMTRIDLSPDPQAAPEFNAPMHIRSTSLLQNEAFVSRCREELTRCIGPMATLIIEDAIDQYPDASPHELVEILASQLSDGKQAEQFVSSIHLSSAAANPTSQVSRSGLTRSQGATSAARSISQGHSRASGFPSSPSISGEPSTNDETGAGLSPDFIHQCQQALTRCVGPMAAMLIEDALADYAHLQRPDFVAQLATEIPDPKKAQEFQQQLLG